MAVGGTGVGVLVGLGVAVGVAVGVTVGGTGVGVTVGVAVGVEVGVGVAVGAATSIAGVEPVPLDTPNIRHEALSVVEPGGPDPGETLVVYSSGEPKVPGLVTVATVELSVVKSTSLTEPALGTAETVHVDAAPPTVNVDGADTVVTLHVGIGVGVAVGGIGVGGTWVGVGVTTTTPPVTVNVVLAPEEQVLFV